MRYLRLLGVFLFFAVSALATVFGTVRGIVHDPQHRPVSDITVILKARNSELTQTAHTDAAGQFHFDAVPLGEYTVAISDSTFAAEPQNVTVLSGTAPVLHLELRLSSQKQEVTVSASDGQSETVTPSSLVDRLQIQETPGASRSNSLAMVLDFVPGSYVTHDQLHIRGGHQVSWLIDGVPIPNTNIASNLGPQIDPEVQMRAIIRAGYGERPAPHRNAVAPIRGLHRRSGSQRQNCDPRGDSKCGFRNA